MAESTGKTDVRLLRGTDGGVFITLVNWGANLAEKALGGPVGVVRAIRDESLQATTAGIDWVEGVNRSSFKIVREAMQRVDKLSQEGVDGLESVTNAIVRAVRGSGEAAADLVSRTAASLVGTKESSAKVA